MAHANSRIAFGKPLSRFQLNQLKIAEMCIKLDDHDATCCTRPLGTPTPTSAATSTLATAAMCKYFCANASFEVD